MARTFARHDRIFPELLDGQRAEGRERGLQALAAIQHAFVEASQPCFAEIHRQDREQAIRVVTRTIIGSCVHRAATSRFWPDDLIWSTWATETTEMALAYLTSPEKSG